MYTHTPQWFPRAAAALPCVNIDTVRVIKSQSGRTGMMLFHELVNGLAQVINGIFVSGGYGVHHAVAEMIL